MAVTIYFEENMPPLTLVKAIAAFVKVKIKRSLTSDYEIKIDNLDDRKFCQKTNREAQTICEHGLRLFVQELFNVFPKIQIRIGLRSWTNVSYPKYGSISQRNFDTSCYCILRDSQTRNDAADLEALLSQRKNEIIKARY